MIKETYFDICLNMPLFHLFLKPLSEYEVIMRSIKNIMTTMNSLKTVKTYVFLRFEKAIFPWDDIIRPCRDKDRATL